MISRSNARTGVKVLLTIGFVSLVSACAHGRSAVLVDPAPVSVGCSLSNHQMVEGISAGLLGRGWTVVGRHPGDLTAQIWVRGKYFLSVSIKYTHRSFDIDYLKSKNLNYYMSDKTRHIHPNANSWMQNINGDIQSQLAGYCAR